MLDINVENLKELEEAMEVAQLSSMEELIRHIKSTGMIYASSEHPIGYMEIDKNGTIYVELKEGHKYLSTRERSGDSFEVYVKEKNIGE